MYLKVGRYEDRVGYNSTNHADMFVYDMIRVLSTCTSTSEQYIGEAAAYVGDKVLFSLEVRLGTDMAGKKRAVIALRYRAP